jgi:hypothetical protein
MSVSLNHPLYQSGKTDYDRLGYIIPLSISLLQNYLFYLTTLFQLYNLHGLELEDDILFRMMCVEWRDTEMLRSSSQYLLGVYKETHGTFEAPRMESIHREQYWTVVTRPEPYMCTRVGKLTSVASASGQASTVHWQLLPARYLELKPVKLLIPTTSGHSALCVPWV